MKKLHVSTSYYLKPNILGFLCNVSILIGETLLNHQNYKLLKEAMKS